MRLIDADAFLKSEIERCGCVPLIGSCSADNEMFKVVLDAQPTVELPKGEWERYKSDTYRRCSECKKVFLVLNDGKRNFCPNCGADMRKKV